jgi:hypothetical protein
VVGLQTPPPRNARAGTTCLICSSRCGDCWSRYSGSNICKTRLQHGLQKLLETVSQREHYSYHAAAASQSQDAEQRAAPDPEFSAV